MERDELIDKAFWYGKVSVREFARIMHVAPQLVYYRLRTKKLEALTCSECGREGLIDFRKGLRSFHATPQDVQAAEETLRQDVGSGDAEDGPGVSM
jgi:hypothetical protein